MEYLSVFSPRRMARLFGRVTFANLVLGVVFCLCSQIPYRNIWLHGSSFVYDAFSSYGPIYMTLLKNLWTYEHTLQVLHETFAAPLLPSYLFISNIGRQLAALFIPNSPSGHAYIQATHSVALVPAVALLLHSFSVPLRYGMLGGTIYGLSGIHVSVSQHTHTHEALLYLVLSLLLLRIYLRKFESVDGISRVALFCCIVVILVSLLRWYHEPVLYFLPIVSWIGVHVWKSWPKFSRNTKWHLTIQLFLMGLAVVICSIPILLTAYEMSHVNKSYITSFAATHVYFSEWPLFWLGLAFPNVTGATYSTVPAPFAVGTDPTLAYLFAGSFTLPFTTIYFLRLFKVGNYRFPFAIIAIGCLLLGFAFGPGSPIYWVLCRLFPPLWMMGHSWYGLHLFYLLSAYCVVQGLRTAIEEPDPRLLALTLFLSVAIIALLFYLIFPAYHYRTFTGSREQFKQTIQSDAFWAALQVSFVLSLLLLFATNKMELKKNNGLFSFGLSMYAKMRPPCWAFAIFILISGFIVSDLIRPIFNAHFVPAQAWMSWMHSEGGGFKPSSTIVKYLATTKGKQPNFRPVRVLSFVGWQGNALYPLDIALIRSGDSQGNRFLEAALRAVPLSEERMKWLTEIYGADFIWVDKSSPVEWTTTLAQSDSFEKVASDPLGGDVYALKGSDRVTWRWDEDSKATLTWYPPPGVVSRVSDQIATAWRFDLTDIIAQTHPAKFRLSLPLMWLSQFEARNENRQSMRLFRDENGLLQVELYRPSDFRFTVQYPSSRIRYGMIASFIMYWLCAIGAVSLFLGRTIYECI
jgi:hypothetical protein